ncbi:MAG: HAD hydrolase-like protein [Candidatus Pacebacteria bacterium]|nr:HAD hydrolase-like protein [Candidatus Paceibacterota bacterium]
MERKILFAWDFHGTLEKGNERAVQELCNLVLKDFGINRELSLKEVLDWYGLSWFDYFKNAFLAGSPELWQNMVNKVFSYQKTGWELIKKYISAQDFAEDVLKKIKERGHQNIILTNSKQDHAEKFIETLGFAKYFDKIAGVDGYLNAHKNLSTEEKKQNAKADALKEFLLGSNFTKIIMIGDNESDIRAGKMVGAKTYLFAAPGKNKKTEATGADHIIFDLREVLKEL